MDAMPQLPLGDEDLLLTAERRLPCIILADRSYSMSGDKIDRLNDGLQVMANLISADMMALKRVEIAIVSFGPVQVEQNFATVDQITMPALDADNDTPMGEAILKGFDLIKTRQQDYHRNSVASYKPWIFLMTDGAATDDTKQAQRLIQSRESQGKVNFFAIGAQGADLNALKSLSVRPPIALAENNFEGLFEFISIIMSSVSGSRPGEQIDIPNPEAIGLGKVVV